MAGHPSSDAVQLQVNRRLSITTHGDQTVPVSSIRQLLRDQHFAIVTIRTPSAGSARATVDAQFDAD
jgi:hypothetical protein